MSPPFFSLLRICLVFWVSCAAIWILGFFFFYFFYRKSLLWWELYWISIALGSIILIELCMNMWSSIFCALYFFHQCFIVFIAEISLMKLILNIFIDVINGVAFLSFFFIIWVWNAFFVCWLLDTGTLLNSFISSNNFLMEYLFFHV